MSTEEFVPVEGRNVVYQIADGEWRPAQIVKVWSTDGRKTCNLVVFIDGGNDARHPEAAGAASDNLVLWKTSRVLGDQVGEYLPRKPHQRT